MMKKYAKVFLILLLSAGVMLAAGFYIWSRFTYTPSDELLKAVDENRIQEQNQILFADPFDSKPSAGVILYPGAKVEPEAYAYIAQELADRGIAAAVPEMPFHFSIFGTGKADDVRRARPNVQNWYVGGHSLGGVAAANYAKENEESVKGVFFLASYPAESANLKKTGLDVLSIYGTNDGLTSLQDIENSKAYTPKDAIFKEIRGGNHAQFGLYGPQKGDMEANIPAIEQQNQIVRYLEEWISKDSIGEK